MKVQFLYELPPLLHEVMERCWLVNHWGKRGWSIPTDLYLEHNNGFTKVCYHGGLDFASLTTDLQNMFAAMGSCASIEYIQEKSSACIELLQRIAHAMSVWVRTCDLNQRHKEVSIKSDIAALCLDLAIQDVHMVSKRMITLIPTQTREVKNANKSAVKDILLEGRKKLVDHETDNEW